MYIQIKIRFPDREPPQKVQRFFDANEAWEKEEKASGRNPDYWEQRSLLDVQVNGIYDGYMAKATGEMVAMSYCFPIAQRNSLPNHRGDLRVRCVGSQHRASRR